MLRSRATTIFTPKKRRQTNLTTRCHPPSSNTYLLPFTELICRELSREHLTSPSPASLAPHLPQNLPKAHNVLAGHTGKLSPSRSKAWWRRRRESKRRAAGNKQNDQQPTAIYKHCDPHVSYHRIRPFLASSKNIADAGVLNGVIDEDGSGTETYHQYGGGSDAQ